MNRHPRVWFTMPPYVGPNAGGRGGDQRPVAHVGADFAEGDLFEDDAEGYRNADARADALHQSREQQDGEVGRDRGHDRADDEA